MRIGNMYLFKVKGEYVFTIHLIFKYVFSSMFDRILVVSLFSLTTQIWFTCIQIVFNWFYIKSYLGRCLEYVVHCTYVWIANNNFEQHQRRTDEFIPNAELVPFIVSCNNRFIPWISYRLNAGNLFDTWIFIKK